MTDKPQSANDKSALPPQPCDERLHDLGLDANQIGHTVTDRSSPGELLHEIWRNVAAPTNADADCVEVQP